MNNYRSLADRVAHFIKLLFSSYDLRLNLSFVCGAIINLVYLAGNVASALIYDSVWSATLSVYHLLLIIIRVYLVFVANSDSIDLDKTLFRTGVFLFLLDLSCAFVMLYTICRGSFIRYSGFFLFAFTVYVVYSLAKSSFAIKKHINDNNHLHFAMRSLSLSTALMSVFNLQYSLLSLLGADLKLTGRIIVVCGALVFIVILLLSIGLIRKSKNTFSSKK